MAVAGEYRRGSRGCLPGLVRRAVKPHRTDISCTAGALRRQGMNTNLNPDYTRVRHGQSVRRGGFALQSVSPCRCPRGRKGPATAIVLPAASGEGGEVSLRSG